LASDNEQMSITPDQNVHIEINTPSTSPTTGALTVVGGVGISGDVNIDGTITFGGAGTTVETSNLAVTDPLVFTGNANQGDALDLGLIGEYATSVSTVTATVSNKALTSDVATITTSAAHGFFAGDIVVITGVDATFNGTHYITGAPTATTFTFVKDAANVTSAAATGSAAVSLKRRFAAVARDASDGVIKFITDITTKPTTTIDFSEAGTTDRGNLVFATSDTGTQNKIIFAAGGLASDNEQMSITPDQNIHIEIDTPSTSPTTGALTVVGGVGISGDVNIDGTITFGGAGTTVETANLAVTDPLVFTGNANQGDALDLGLIGEYATSVSTVTATVSNKALSSDVATITTSAAHGFVAGDIVVITGVDATFNGTHYITGAPTTTTFTFVKDAANVTSAAATGSAAVSLKRRFAAVARDASDGVIKFITDITTKPTTTIDFSEAGSTYADIRVDDITADAITANSASIGDVSNTELQYLNGVTSAIQTQLDTKLASTTAASTYAPLASPALTGTPTSTTAEADTNTTQIATTAYVVGQGYLKSTTAATSYAPLTAAQLIRPVLTSAFETNAVSATAATGTVNVDLSTAAVHYYTANSAANWTFNFRGNGSTTLNSLLSVGQSATVAFLVTNGSTPYYPTAFQVDGVALSSGTAVKWQGGVAPTSGNASSIDSYTFTIIKTGSATYTVLGAQAKFA